MSNIFAPINKKGLDPNIRFIILNGDIVRHSNKESWIQVQKELMEFNLPYYFVMGNHDNSAYSRELFKKMFGNTFYSFTINAENFIVLNSQKQPGIIPSEQLKFLEKSLTEDPKIETFFIFFHELLWTTHHPRYKSVRHNYGTYSRVFSSNFWRDVYPIFPMLS